MNDADHLADVLDTLGDWLIVWLPEPHEGWDASLHDTSACYCHAPVDLQGPKFCADPTLITREQADVLIARGIARTEEDAA